MVFIKYNTPSSKNSKINTSKGSFMSKTVKKYLRAHGIQTFSSSKKTVTGFKTIPMTFPIEELKEELKSKTWPLMVGMHFVRGSKRKFDYNNATQIVADLLTAFDIIPDDDSDHFYAVPFIMNGTYYNYDKENPGVYIKLIPHNTPLV